MKRIICTLLALLTVALCFVSCGEETKTNDESSQVSDNENTSGNINGTVTDTSDGQNNNDGVIYADLLDEATDMGGREFYILQRWFGYGKPTIDFQGEVIWEDSEDGTMTNINKAKKEVLDAVEKEYNCTITGEMSTDTPGNIRTALNEDILGGTAEYDFCFESYYYYYAFVEDGLLADLNDLGVDLKQPWWDQNAVDDLSICGELYYALGDINTYDNDGTVLLFFNKDLYIKNGGDPQELYDMALNGEWTFDAFVNEVTGFGYDANSDGKRDEFDVYGLLTETSGVYNHFLASGNRIVDKNANDEPIFDLASGNGYAALTDAVNLYLNTNDVLVGNLPEYVSKYEGEDVYEKTVINAFKEGRGLFYVCAPIHLPYFRDMKDDYGFLPIPKYNAEDDRYYHNMGAHITSVLFVPVGDNSKGENGKQLATVLDALGAYSKDYLTPEYYEKQLKRADSRDPYSADVLDIVYGSRIYDLGQVFGGKWNTTSIIEELDTNIQSRVDGQKDIIEMNIALTVDKVKANAAKQ
ncbi:MAG: hypothetical protein E7597_08130 [Ruminococcaceae bacterium]|nr:hypothetical protein [Oscillospiraceae bacterium]